MIRITEENSRIEMTIGSLFEVALRANPTSGYTWKQESVIKEITQIGTVAFHPSSDNLGAESLEIFTYKALNTGKVKLVYTYSRDWLPDKALDTKEFEINITLKKSYQRNQ